MGKWKVLNQVFGEVRKYIAGRQLNLNEPLHGGNVEYSGGYSENRGEAEELCNRLNSEVVCE